MTAPDAPQGAGSRPVAAERTYLVYDGRTGAIRHIHQSVVFAGAASRTVAEESARALDLAAHCGHAPARLRVLLVKALDPSVPQRVDVRRQRLMALAPTKRRGVTTRSAPSSKRAAAKTPPRRRR